MKRITLLLLLILMYSISSHGQDFKKVVDIVVTMESSLKSMLAKEAADRSTEIAALKAELSDLRKAIGHDTTSPSTTMLLQRLETLEKKVSSLQSPTDSAALTSQLAALVTEMKKLRSAPAPSQPAVQLSGQAFGFFGYTSDGIEGKDANRFDFDRVYFTAKTNLFEGGKFQFTTDMYRNAAAGTYYAGLSIRIKFAYLDYAPAQDVSIKIGMIPTHWPGYVDGFWKYRGVQTTISDRNGYFSTSDLGISGTYTFPGKLGEISGFVFNGSGYTAPESNRFKDLAVRATLTPFATDPVLKGFVLVGYAYKGTNQSAASAALKRDRIGGLAGMSYSIASVYCEYNARTDAATNPDTVVMGNAISFFGEIKAPFEDLKNTWAFLWRHDVAEPNTSKGGDMNRYSLFGISYKPNEKVTLVLDHSFVKAETASLKRNDGSKTDSDKRWFVHMILTF